MRVFAQYHRPVVDMVCSRLTDGLVIVVYGRRPPPDQEWLAYLRQMESWTRARNGRMPVQLIFSQGGHPTTQQWALTQTTVRRAAPRPARRAMLTDARSLLNVIRLASAFIEIGDLRWFGWDEVESALQFVESDFEPERVRQERARLWAAIT